MYYEEKIFNGILMWRNAPDGDWRQVSIEGMSQRIVQQKAEIDRLENELKQAQQDATGEHI